MSSESDPPTPQPKGRRWRPRGAQRKFDGLYHRMWHDFGARPVFSLPQDAHDRPASGIGQVRFDYTYAGSWSVEDLPPTNTDFFANKATTLYSYRDAHGQREQQFHPIFEVWMEAAADYELAQPGYRHYPVAPAFWDPDEDPPSLLDVIRTHQALARRVQQMEGQMIKKGVGPGTERMRMRDPFPRCLIWCTGTDAPRHVTEFWLVAEKGLVGDIGEEVEGSGIGDQVWVQKKMDVKEAMRLILHLPRERLEGNVFKLRWEDGEDTQGDVSMVMGLAG